MPDQAGGEAAANDANVAVTGDPSFDKRVAAQDRVALEANVRAMEDKLSTEQAAVEATREALRAAKAELKESG